MPNLAAVRDVIKDNLTIVGSVKDSVIDGYVRSVLRANRQKRYWFLRKRKSLTLSVGLSSVTLPADYSVVEQINLLMDDTRYTHESGFRLVDYQTFTDAYIKGQPSSQGKPLAATIFNGNILLDQAAQTDATIEIVYYAQDEVLPTADNDTSVWFDDGFDYIRSAAQYMVDAFNMGNPQASQVETAAFKQALDEQAEFYEVGE